ncbi:MAG: flagellar FlbD family protein [Lachnospiraceae bacterium]|nr:flagellar FlbD family protein [Lachnospiraceae bacterium]
MIKLTKLNGEEFVLNAELIKTIETTPDTIVTITSGNKYIVKEEVEEVIEAVMAYKRSIFQNFMN